MCLLKTRKKEQGQIEAYGQTDIGLRRRLNQDSIYVANEQTGGLPNLFILADGMGGHSAGETASTMLIECFSSFVQKTEKMEPVRIFDNAISLSNRLIYQKSLTSPSLAGMGTTLVAASIAGNILTCSNVGDSRLYIISGDEIRQITKDHSLVEEMVRSGAITRESEEYRTQKNILTRAVGVEPVVEADFFDESLQDGDVIMLCSDGLTNMLSNEQILRTVKESDSLKSAVESLIKKANDNGGIDNIGVILISYRKAGEPDD